MTIQYEGRASKIYLSAIMAGFALWLRDIATHAGVVVIRPLYLLIAKYLSIVWEWLLFRSGVDFSLGQKFVNEEKYMSMIGGIMLVPLAVALPFILLAGIRRMGSADVWGEVKNPPLSAYLIAVSVGLGISVFGAYLGEGITGLLASSGLREAAYPVALPFDGFSWGLQILSICLFPALFEELCFRGILLSEIRRAGPLPAALLSSLFFALCHANLASMPTALMFGLFAAGLRLHYHSVKPGIAAHFVVNLSALVFTWLYDHLGDGALRMTVLLTDALFLLLAGVALLALTRGVSRREDEAAAPAASSGLSFLLYALSPTIIVFVAAELTRIFSGLSPL